MSVLYQEKLLTVVDINTMRKDQYLPNEVVLMQCAKIPVVVAKTADMLDTLNCTEEAIVLKG